jgi:hypothetical protein
LVSHYIYTALVINTYNPKALMRTTPCVISIFVSY